MPYSFVPLALQPEDDVDELFSQLGQLEPPDELVARILTHVRRLPDPSMLSPCFQPDKASDGGCEGPVVRNDWRDPS